MNIRFALSMVFCALVVSNLGCASTPPKVRAVPLPNVPVTPDCMQPMPLVPESKRCVELQNKWTGEFTSTDMTDYETCFGMRPMPPAPPIDAAPAFIAPLPPVSVNLDALLKSGVNRVPSQKLCDKIAADPKNANPDDVKGCKLREQLKNDGFPMPE